MAINI
jgi:anaphase-promoting complex subunit 3